MRLIKLEKLSILDLVISVTYKTLFGRTVKRQAILCDEYYRWCDTDELFTSHRKLMTEFHLSELQELKIKS